MREWECACLLLFLLLYLDNLGVRLRERSHSLLSCFFPHWSRKPRLKWSRQSHLETLSWLLYNAFSYGSKLHRWTEDARSSGKEQENKQIFMSCGWHLPTAASFPGCWKEVGCCDIYDSYSSQYSSINRCEWFSRTCTCWSEMIQKKNKAIVFCLEIRSLVQWDPYIHQVVGSRNLFPLFRVWVQEAWRMDFF